MNPKIGYNVAKIIGIIRRDKHNETLNKWFIKRGVMLESDGKNIYINSNIAINEPELISIGEGTTIAGNVEFVTHDNSISKVIPTCTDLFGEIKIGRNCFIGARSVILYGVRIADNVIVSAGSVVTKSINESNVIVGGNPARVISSWERFESKSKPYIWNFNEISRDEVMKRLKQGERVIRR